MSKLLSVILPTYNVRPYLGQCLDSIIAQTYTQTEIIIVIDGATDGSYELAREYAERDSRIRVIWQENAGSGPARNRGLEYVSGEYVMFVDPDDWLEKNYFAHYMAVCDTAGLVIGGSTLFYEEHPSRQIEKKYPRQNISGESEARRQYISLLTKGALAAPTAKLYRMSLIRNHHLSFPDLRRSQDMVFNYRYYHHLSSICLIEDTGYHYRIIGESQNLKLGSDYYRTLAMIYSEILRLYEDWSMTMAPEDHTALCSFFLPSVMANCEANLLRKEDIRPILTDETIRTIVRGASGTRPDRKLFRWLYRTHCVWGVKLLLRAKIKARKEERRSG